MIRLVGLGAGGHAKVVSEILSADGRYHLVGLLDCDRRTWGTKVVGVPVLGDDSRLDDLATNGTTHFFVGVGSVADSRHRRRLYDMAIARGLEPVSTIHPTAVISPSAVLGRGVVVMAGAIINAGVVIGDNVIVNTAAVIEHDCTIGNHVHVATRGTLAGRVRVAAGAHVGAGATIRQNLEIGEQAIVGAGAVVVTNVAALSVVVGVPARVLRKVV